MENLITTRRRTTLVALGVGDPFPGVIFDLGFKVTVVLKGDLFYRHRYYRMLIGNQRQAIEWCHVRCP